MRVTTWRSTATAKANNLGTLQYTERKSTMAKYRAGVIGLGWMGLLYDMAGRLPYRQGIDTADSIDKPTPELDVHRQFHLYERHLPKGVPTSYSEALHDRPEIDLVAGCDRDPNRLKAFGDRYGDVALYTDGAEMLEKEKLDIVAIATNTRSRPELVRLAVENGAKAIVTDKPMCHTLAEADLMVGVCRDAGVPLNCGAISTTHPSFVTARELLDSGAIGDVVSLETSFRPGAQHQNWSYFLDSAPAWVVGTADKPPLETGSSEFKGQGILVCDDGTILHFREGAPMLRISGTIGEMVHSNQRQWTLSQDFETVGGIKRVDVPWSGPQTGHYGTTYSVADIMDCLAGELDEPKNSGRRVAVALEAEIALKVSSANGGQRVDLPLEDRSLGLEYEWWR